MSRILCLGDAHLGAGTDYGREPGDRLRDQARVLTEIVHVAEAEQVDAVLFAGDMWHRRRPTPDELMVAGRFFGALRALGLPVLAIAGNHDVETSDRATGYEVFSDLIDVHREPGIWNGPGVTVATLPWMPRQSRDDLVNVARGLRASINGPAILLGHWSVTGARTPTGMETREFGETTIPAHELAAMGWDAVVLGHIHLPQRIVPELARDIFYVGSTAVVDFGEAESEHGVWILDTEAAGDTGARFVPIPGRPFVTLDFDVESLASTGDLYLALAAKAVTGAVDVTEAVVRVRYRATEEQARRVDHRLVAQALYDVGVHKVYQVEAVIDRAARSRVEGLDDTLTEQDALDLWIAANPDRVGDHADDLRALTARYLEGAPS